MAVRIVEVGPRDGLQGEPTFVPTAVKVAFVEALAASGVAEVEASAFVAPDWVPQLADADALFAALRRRPGVTYAALVPNEQGLERALRARVDKVAVFTAASESFSQKNVNASLAGVLARLAPVVRRARDAGLAVRGYVSTAVWCPYEGFVAPERSLAAARALLELGVDELSLGDTLGKATVDEVRALLDVVLAEVPSACLALHLHDTYGRALANVLAAWRAGITTFDASVAGLGGCPYAPGAPGNVATEAVVEALAAAGAEVHVDLAELRRAAGLIAPFLPPLSR